MPVLNTLNVTAINATVFNETLSNHTLVNATAHALQVVCAFPLSGQYGPGSRILYYILIAACVFARKAEWLRNACLAAALLFPAVAALHCIVLAAVHVQGAVDMDIFGAFQLCAIGILAAPVTVRLSTTYFNAPGRNIIFLWTVLILAGLLSLTVEFFRIKTSDCIDDKTGNPFYTSPSQFKYGTQCGLTCSPEDGPFSPLRGGAQNNIYVIPAPGRLTFGTATLLSAGCCVPSILYLIFMWNKILEINWRSRFGHRSEDEEPDEFIEGTNGATVAKMKGVNNLVGLFLSVVEIPVFTAAVLAILIFGERNFFSPPVIYQTEPMFSVGQWAPIVGTGLAVLGSLYVLLATKLTVTKEDVEQNDSPPHQCNCSKRRVSRDGYARSSHSMTTPSAIDMSNEIVPTISRKSGLIDAGNRRKVAKGLKWIGTYLGTASEGRFDDAAFRRGRAMDFPEIPGEDYRNRALPQIRREFNADRGEDGNITPVVSRPRSRANSVNSRLNVEASSPPMRGASPRRATLEVPPQGQGRSGLSWDVPSRSPSLSAISRAQTSPTVRVSTDLEGPFGSPSPPEPPTTPPAVHLSHENET